MAAPVMNRVVPDFKCPATGDQTIHMQSLKGRKVVIYFYPKDSTPGCTTEGQDFRDLHAKFKRQNTVILGVSRDSIGSHEKSLYGRKFMGVVRSTFLIDESGKLLQEWRTVKVNGHAAEVLEAVKNC